MLYWYFKISIFYYFSFVNGSGSSAGTWSTSDVFALAATENNDIQFIKNGIVLHTEPYISSSYKLYFILNELNDGFNYITTRCFSINW